MKSKDSIDDDRRGNKNIYTCDICGCIIVTVDSDRGVTPMFLACKSTTNCRGTMTSAMYLVDPGLNPTWEWYRPDSIAKDDVAYNHVVRGGLLLREITDDKS